MSSPHRPFVVAALMLAMFMAAMEATVVATAMPTVIADLGGLAVYGWVGAAYLLASTVSVPVYGKLADRRGRKPILMLGIGVFLVGSLASGLAGSIGELVAFRALQGLGAGAMQPMVLTVVGDLYPPAERGRVQGLFSAVWGAAGVCGPLLGGAIVSLASWPWVFWINIPFGLASAGILAWAYREAPRPAPTTRLDVPGALALMASATALLLAASGVAPLVTLPAGIVGAAALLAIEARAADPVLPLSLLGRRLVAVTAASSALLGAAMTGALNYLPLHVQGVLLASPTVAGVAVAPMLVGWPLAAAATSRAIVRVGYRGPIVLGTSLTAISLLLVVPLAVGRADPRWIGVVMLLLGLGMGFANSALIIGVQASVGWEQRGVATAITMFSRTMGGAIGAGGLGALLGARLAGAGVPLATVRALLDPHGPPGAVSPAVAEVLGSALDPLFAACAVGGFASLAVALAYPPREVAQASHGSSR